MSEAPDYKDAATSFRSMLRQAWLDGYYRGHIDGTVARAPAVPRAEDEHGHGYDSHLLDPDPMQRTGELLAEMSEKLAPIMDAPDVKPTRKPRTKDKKQIVCSVCSRVGSRGFRENPDGTHRCVDLDACKTRTYKPKAPRTKPKPEPIPESFPESIEVGELPAPIPETPAPVPESPPRSLGDIVYDAFVETVNTPIDAEVISPAVTARCTDCPRSWTITDERTLRNAATMHELRHSHIVDILALEKSE